MNNDTGKNRHAAQGTDSQLYCEIRTVIKLLTKILNELRKANDGAYCRSVYERMLDDDFDANF